MLLIHFYTNTNREVSEISDTSSMKIVAFLSKLTCPVAILTIRNDRSSKKHQVFNIGSEYAAKSLKITSIYLGMMYLQRRTGRESLLRAQFQKPAHTQ